MKADNSSGLPSENPIWVGYSDQITEGGYVKIQVKFAGKLSSVLVLRFQGQCIAYLNKCVHLPFGLDSQKEMIFDDSGNNLQCSMHGIVYEPISGASKSILCHGKRLTSVKIKEDDEGIWIIDPRFRPIAVTSPA